jgi:hypothetical protein
MACGFKLNVLFVNPLLFVINKNKADHRTENIMLSKVFYDPH